MGTLVRRLLRSVHQVGSECPDQPFRGLPGPPKTLVATVPQEANSHEAEVAGLVVAHVTLVLDHVRDFAEVFGVLASTHRPDPVVLLLGRIGSVDLDL